jgi:hypothetical protein
VNQSAVRAGSVWDFFRRARAWSTSIQVAIWVNILVFLVCRHNGFCQVPDSRKDFARRLHSAAGLQQMKLGPQ